MGLDSVYQKSFFSCSASGPFVIGLHLKPTQVNLSYVYTSRKLDHLKDTAFLSSLSKSRIYATRVERLDQKNCLAMMKSFVLAAD